jgi:hypothetical protein
MSKRSSLEPATGRGPAVADAVDRTSLLARLDNIGFAVAYLDGTVGGLQC